MVKVDKIRRGLDLLISRMFCISWILLYWIIIPMMYIIMNCLVERQSMSFVIKESKEDWQKSWNEGLFQRCYYKKKGDIKNENIM